MPNAMLEIIKKCLKMYSSFQKGRKTTGLGLVLTFLSAHKSADKKWFLALTSLKQSQNIFIFA